MMKENQAEKGNGKSSTYLVGPTHVEAVGNGALESSPARACKIGFAVPKWFVVSLGGFLVFMGL